MIFIAESGSTKCDAVFTDRNGREIKRIETMGFNPYFHSASFIREQLELIPEVHQYGPQVKQVFFYGAGCSSPALNAVVAEGFSPYFPQASIHIDHDLTACAYATYTGEPAISCILGTGSNSVFFDGNTIREEVPALAFILGDEGSASYIGKKVLSGYLYKQLPAEAMDDFSRTYGLTKEDIINRVYTKPNANVFLGGFAPFAHKHKEVPYFWEMVFTGFKTFLEVHVNCFPESQEVPIHFVGSIAHHFQDILSDALEHLNLRKGHIIQKPLDGLIQYHRKYLLPANPPLKSL